MTACGSVPRIFPFPDPAASSGRVGIPGGLAQAAVACLPLACPPPPAELRVDSPAGGALSALGLGLPPCGVAKPDCRFGSPGFQPRAARLLGCWPGGVIGPLWPF